jgi:hypothetical protein
MQPQLRQKDGRALPQANVPIKEDNNDSHVSVSFSFPKSIKEEMDQRIASLRITRSDYLKWMILSDLDKGPDALFDFPRKPRSIV